MSETIDRPQVQLFAPDLDTEDFRPDLTLEHELLGTLLVYEAQGRTDVFDEIRAAVAAEDFFFPAHQTIWREICDLKGRGLPATPKAISPRVEGVEGLEIHGAAGYIRALSEGASLFDREMQWAALELRRKRLCRGAMEAAARLYEAARDAQTDGDPEVALATAEQAIAGLMVDNMGESITTIGAAADRVLDAAEDRANGAPLPAVRTGLPSLDGIIGGLPIGGMTILAARPSMGKSALAGWIAHQAAAKHWATAGKEGAEVAFFSLEMNAEQLASRVLGIGSGVTYSDIHQGQLRPDDFGSLELVRADLHNLPLTIIDKAGMSAGDIGAAVRTLRRRHNIKLVVVDYLQFMRSDDRYRGQRVNEVAEMSRALREIAKAEKVAMLVLCQLNRGVEARATERRGDARPTLADLRDSGSIEQDADVVLMLYRPEVYLARQLDGATGEKAEELARDLAAMRNVAFVDVAKQRMGRLDRAKLHFLKESGRFTDRGLPFSEPEQFDL
ncbi:replicative DNA helicase [Marinibaculum pumilum]|uniref:DNA 5'-3' helicase n=1 Tax=Marinibaculum pumilum TaxID=1766165 RepID=A0ABV7KY76_9PROT